MVWFQIEKKGTSKTFKTSFCLKITLFQEVSHFSLPPLEISTKMCNSCIIPNVCLPCQVIWSCFIVQVHPVSQLIYWKLYNNKETCRSYCGRSDHSFSLLVIYGLTSRVKSELPHSQRIPRNTSPARAVPSFSCLRRTSCEDIVFALSVCL